MSIEYKCLGSGPIQLIPSSSAIPPMTTGKEVELIVTEIEIYTWECIEINEQLVD